jgi:hypothetical protein
MKGKARQPFEIYIGFYSEAKTERFAKESYSTWFMQSSNTGSLAMTATKIDIPKLIEGWTLLQDTGPIFLPGAKNQ